MIAAEREPEQLENPTANLLLRVAKACEFAIINSLVYFAETPCKL